MVSVNKKICKSTIWPTIWQILKTKLFENWKPLNCNSLLSWKIQTHQSNGLRMLKVFRISIFLHFSTQKKKRVQSLQLKNQLFATPSILEWFDGSESPDWTYVISVCTITVGLVPAGEALYPYIVFEILRARPIVVMGKGTARTL